MKTLEKVNHLATVQTIYEAFGKGDIPTILAQLADDIRWEDWADNSTQSIGLFYMIPRQGREGVMEFFQSLTRLEIRKFNVLSLMAGPNQVAAEVEIELYFPDTNSTVTDEEIHLWNFNDAGKATRFRHYLDTHKHVERAKKASA